MTMQAGGFTVLACEGYFHYSCYAEMYTGNYTGRPKDDLSLIHI